MVLMVRMATVMRFHYFSLEWRCLHSGRVCECVLVVVRAVWQLPSGTHAHTQPHTQTCALERAIRYPGSLTPTTNGVDEVADDAKRESARVDV